MDNLEPNIFYSPQFSSNAFVVHPGEFFISDKQDIMIITILGSCVAACIRDTEKKIGGLNHFLLPGSADKDSGSNRFGAYAMEQLINEILKKGGKRENLEVKVFGGASLLSSHFDVGKRNIDFIREYLRIENLKITSEDLGGTQARRIHYWPGSGKILRLIISSETKNIIDKEKVYQNKVGNSLVGDVELFN
jgi:chemotaxis protein CheD